MNREFNIPENIFPEAQQELKRLLQGNRNFVNGQPTAKKYVS